MKKIVIVDYGMGNLRSVQKGFEKVGHHPVITDSPEDILGADAVVLPGVGAFRDCMKNLEIGKLVGPILEVIERGTPFLGICLGLQLLFTESEEFGTYKGLGVIKGKVRRFPTQFNKLPTDPNGSLKVPHMGWNNIKFKKKTDLFRDINDGEWFYFVHSYYVESHESEVVAATTDYGIEFTAAVSRDNLYAVQFHPEKSQTEGLKIFKRFGDLVE